MTKDNKLSLEGLVLTQIEKMNADLEMFDVCASGILEEEKVYSIETGECNLDSEKFWNHLYDVNVNSEAFMREFSDRLCGLLESIGFDTDRPISELEQWARFDSHTKEDKKIDYVSFR